MLSGNKTNQENPSDQNCSYWYVDNDLKVTENETDASNDCNEIFEKVGPNYNSHLEDNGETESNDETDDGLSEQKESSLPEENRSLTEDEVKTVEEKEEKISDIELLFGNEVSVYYFSIFSEENCLAYT